MSPLLGAEPLMPFRIVISIVNEVHSAAHNQSSTQNYGQDKIKILRKFLLTCSKFYLLDTSQKKKKLNFPPLWELD